jgi:hypothetical protein
MAYERKTYDLFISDELKEVLEQIKSESVVADLLLKRRHSKEDLVDDPINFVSISSQDSTRISYLTTERIGMINEGEFWTSSRRFHMKPGGFISKVFKNISAKDVEVFSNLYRSEVRKPKFEFKIVNGEDIRRYYHYDYHANDYGSLGVSCMRYESCQKLFNMYVENSDKISLLLMLNEDGRVMGRTLLWNFDGNRIMDRIYSVNDEQLPFYFKKWATENGYYYKSQQNWYNSIQFERLGEGKKLLKLDVKLDSFDFRYYPYMDTFKFFNPDTGTFSNYRPEGRDHYTLCSSDGSKYDWNYLEYDDFDKVYRHRGETVRLNYLNMNAHPDRCNYSEIHDQYLLSDHSQWRDDLRDYVFSGEYSNLNDVNRIEQRIKDNEEYEKERESRRSRRGYSISQRILESLSNPQSEIDMSSLYQQYVTSGSAFDQINISTQTESTEE